jgi:hypothetical protein
MKYASYLLLLVLSLPSNASEDYVNFDMNFSVADRSGDLRWSIAGSNNSPNILSELTYSNIKIREYNFDWVITGTDNFAKNFFLSIEFGLGSVYDGTSQDSDYFGDNRSIEFRKRKKKIKNGNTRKIDLMASVSINPTNKFRIVPGLGYSSKSHKLVKTNGVQIISEASFIPDPGPFPGLNASYETSWSGLYFNLGLRYEGNKHIFEFNKKLHMNNYYAKADWNLREDFEHPISFKHTGSGGLDSTLKIKYVYRITDFFGISIKQEFENFKVANGLDKVYLANGSRASTKLNESKWSSSATFIGINLLF